MLPELCYIQSLLTVYTKVFGRKHLNGVSKTAPPLQKHIPVKETSMEFGSVFYFHLMRFGEAILLKTYFPQD